MSKISMFGVSRSGKTCFLYAMAQVLGKGVRYGDNLVQVISTRARQQTKLNDGFMQLAERRWPQNSDKTESFFFKVSMQSNGHFDEVIESLEIQDYRGGLLERTQSLDEEEFNELMTSFRGSSAIIFIVDGKTLMDALDDDNKDVSHRGQIDVKRQFMAQSQIRFVENIFMEYKLIEAGVPPILIAISKGDNFASDFERENAKKFLKESLPSIFSIGSKVTAGISIMSLGENLGADDNGNLTGFLSLSTDYNIHIPVIFGIYADLCYRFEKINDEEERKKIIALLTPLRRLFADRVQLFISGKQAREV